MIPGCVWFSSRESTLKKEIDEERASLQKSISDTSALITQKDEELEKLRNEVNEKKQENPMENPMASSVWLVAEELADLFYFINLA